MSMMRVGMRRQTTMGEPGTLAHVFVDAFPFARAAMILGGPVCLLILILSMVRCTTGHAAQVQPMLVCTKQVMVPIVTAQDAFERPVSVDKVATDPPLCGCSDNVTVRLCQ